MARRRNTDKPEEPPVQKPPTRVPRRKRRKPSSAKPQSSHGPAKQPQHGGDDGYTLPEYEPAPIKMSRAPRPAELPPSNPNVFSYTYTIWKSS